MNRNIIAWGIGLVFLAGTVNAAAAAAAPVEAAEPAEPAYYDLRLSVPTDRNSPALPEKALVNPIRNQGVYGTCWAFATIAAVESNMYLKLQQAGIPYNVNHNDVNLSEWYLAWVSRFAPTEVENDTVSHVTEPIGAGNFNRPLSVKVYTGGESEIFAEYMGANNVSLVAEAANAEENPLARIIAPKQYLPQAVQLQQIYINFEQPSIAKTDGRLVKQKIMRNGAVTVAIRAQGVMDAPGDDKETAYFSAKPMPQDHAVNIVGWDDDYDFSQSGLAVLPLHKGAWIIRNSWGTAFGDKGYCYLSYEDVNLIFGSAFETDLDTGAVSSIDRHEDAIDAGSAPYGGVDKLPPSWFASGEKAQQSEFLRRVGFYALDDGMGYTIEIRTGTDAPEAGRVVYTQQGTFGQDGTPSWSGYRTVALQKYIFLPKDEEYMVSVRLSNPKGTVKLLTTPTMDPPAPRQVTSYVRIGDDGAWYKDFTKDPALPEAIQNGSVIQREYLKNAVEPMGRDFTVVSLDDSRHPGQADIQLGREDELYGKDRLHPDRRTLSNMTVELAADESYSGTIHGEGQVIKRGPGSLTLTGAQKYTGLTQVEEGGLYLAARSNGGMASLAGSVEIAPQGSFGGSGIVQGDVTGTGTLHLTAAGILQVNGHLAPGLQVQVENAEALTTGQVLLQSPAGIPADFNGLSAGSHHLVLRENQTQLVVE